MENKYKFTCPACGGNVLELVADCLQFACTMKLSINYVEYGDPEIISESSDNHIRCQACNTVIIDNRTLSEYDDSADAVRAYFNDNDEKGI